MRADPPSAARVRPAVRVRALLVGAAALALGLALHAGAWAAPGDAGGATPASPARTAAQIVQRIQELLKQFGDYRGAVDGRLGADTVTAIRSYQRRSGLPEDGAATEAVLNQIEFATAAAQLRTRIDAARADQVQTAALALLAQPQTRQLIAGRPTGEAADPTRDVAGCFAAPTTRCLLEEASESAKAISDYRTRDWALGEIVLAQAKAGLPVEAFQTAGRILDPRLIIAALRDIVIGRAATGDIDQAVAASALIPDALARVTALAGVAESEARAGRPDAVAKTLADVERLVAGLPAAQVPAQLLAQLGVALYRVGYPKAGTVIDAARLLAETGPAEVREAALASVAAALAQSERTGAAEAVLASLTQRDSRRVVLASLATAYARNGGGEQAERHALAIEEPQYRALSLAAVGAAQAASGDQATARRTLAHALSDARSVDLRSVFARSNALGAVARAHATAGFTEEALAIARSIADATVRVEAEWAVANAMARDGDPAGLAAIRAQFMADIDGITNALDRVWVLSNAAVTAARTGDSAAAQLAFAGALRESQGIPEAGPRSRAVAKVATTLVTLDWSAGNLARPSPEQ